MKENAVCLPLPSNESMCVTVTYASQSQNQTGQNHQNPKKPPLHLTFLACEVCKYQIRKKLSFLTLVNRMSQLFCELLFLCKDLELLNVMEGQVIRQKNVQKLVLMSENLLQFTSNQGYYTWLWILNDVYLCRTFLPSIKEQLCVPVWVLMRIIAASLWVVWTQGG